MSAMTLRRQVGQRIMVGQISVEVISTHGGMTTLAVDVPGCVRQSHVRRIGEGVFVGECASVKVIQAGNRNVRLRVEAPRDVRITRAEQEVSSV